MNPTRSAGRGMAALGSALEQLLAILDRPETTADHLREAWESCAAREEELLERLRECRDASEDEREELAELLRNVARLHGLALQAANRERDGAADALRRARAALGGLRSNRAPDVAGGSFDVEG